MWGIRRYFCARLAGSARLFLCVAMVTAGAGAAAADDAPVMVQEDVDFLNALSRFRPAEHFAVLYLANECVVAPTQDVFDAAQHTEIWDQVVTVFQQRLLPDKPAGGFVLRDLAPFPVVPESVCAALTRRHVQPIATVGRRR